ncbi:hypothetical protein [Glutamicibacter sp. V16R2B1]|uniref:hypothetical protein n=1 Tax=Glutamicibacter sp. V16R2B1 TaxID=2036207 RepID=UPI0010FD8844|nr:hypothetical protein [Glutamicibacter sp. V16R2B1]TLK47805.1 hypothetical protein FDN03_15595 [Glutamicibacter sp. V16R2B1]
MDWRTPDWPTLINIDTLDMDDPSSDIVGQLRAHYPPDALNCIDQYDHRLGFNIVPEQGDWDDDQYAELTALWIAEIRRRTGGAA